MSTEEEGGTTTATGTGGKFRKRSFRRQTTPYDRPPTAIRPINNNGNFHWLTKHVVDPASKLISYGANRFFDSVLRKRLPGPTLPPQAPGLNHDVGGGFQEAVSNELIVRESSQAINSSDSNGISDLEQLLKQSTFTRAEIVRLTELLHSKAAEASLVDKCERMETPSGYDRHEKISGGLTVDNRNKGIRSHGTTSTPLFNPKVLEDDIGSPAELAKAYMGSRPSKVSPSMLSMHGHGGREDTLLFGNAPFNSKSPITPFAKKSLVSHGAVENCFITPRSRGRSAIYSMARTPYSRGYPTSIVKFQGVGNNNNDFGQSMPSSSRSLSAHSEQLESKSTALKRRSSYLDDEVGSVGPIRRIRQKQNLLAPRVSHTVHGSGISAAKQKQPLIGEANHDRLKGVVENENGSVPSTSYAVPSKSSEVASRILQHLEKLTPKEKSSDKSPFKLTPGMLHGQALRSMENVGTSKFMQDVQDDHKMEDMSNGDLSDARESTSEKQEKVKEKGSEESVAPSELWSSAKKNESLVPLKDPGPSSAAFDSVFRNGASQQPPQKKRAFRMSAQEDSFDQDDDVHDDGIAPTPLPEKKGPTEVPLMESNLSTAEEPKSVKTTIQPEEVKSTSSFVLSKTSEFGVPSSGNAGERSGALASSAPEESSKASQPAIAFDKPKDNPPPLFSFSSNVGDKFPPLPSESSGKTSEPKMDSPNRFFNTPVPNGYQSKTLESDNGNLNPPKPADKIQKPDTATPTLNGPVASNPPTFSFNTSSSSGKNQIATTVGATTVSAPSTSITSFTSTGTGTSTSSASTGIFGSIVAPSTSKGPIFSFTATYPSTSVSTASTTITSEATDSKTNTNPIFGGSSNPAFPPFSSASSGTSIFGPASSATDSAPVTPQISPLNSVPVPQGSSAQSVSFTPFPSFSTNTSTPFGSSFSNSQPFNSNPTSLFGGSSASSSDTNSLTPVSGPAPTVAKFSSTTSTNTIGSSSAATSSPFIFSGSSSSTTTNTVGSSSTATSSPFIFSGSSSSTTTNTIASSSVAISSPFIFGGSSSSASANTIGSSPAATSSPFIFGGSSFASSSAPMNSTSAPSNPFGSSVFGSSSTPSTRFLFGAASSTPSAPTNTAPSIFTSSTNTSPSPIFPFSAQSAPSLQTPSQPVFGSPNFGFGASPGNNMNAEDSMAEDPVQSTSLFGQPAVSPSPPGFMFGQPPPAQVNPFQFGGQQSQVNQVNPNPFQASGSVEFNATGSFSLGTGGGDKSGRRILRPSKSRNRKK